MNVTNLLLLIGLFAVVHVGSAARRLESDDINMNLMRSGSTQQIIRVPRGKRIVIRINQLKLASGGYLTLKDGRYGQEQRYSALGSRIFDRYRQTLNFPFEFETSTAKLFITVSGSRGDRLSAHYTSYNTNSGCLKKDVHSGPANISCDSDNLSPVARTCGVTIRCNENYLQYSTQKVCNDDGDWEGQVSCLPKGDLLGRCSYDFENFTINDECPFDPTEIVQYYMDVEHADPYEKTLGRSGHRKINCAEICSHTAGGWYKFRCPQRINRWNRNRFVKCFKCRMIYGCRRGTVV